MPKDEGQEKTEKATGKKLQDQRKKGKVAKSTEINSFSTFFFGLIILFTFKSFIGTNVAGLAIYVFSSLDKLTLESTLIQIYFAKMALLFFFTVSPVLLGIMITALIVNIGQVGFIISWEALKPKLDKFNPLSGIKKLFFSSKSIVEILKATLKLLIIGGFTYFVLDDLIMNSLMVVNLTIFEIVDHMLNSALTLVLKISLVFAVFAISDFIWQKYKFNKDMKMTKQEVKEETKQTEGDPQVKGKIKSLQFLAARNRMIQDIPNADVVVTNPTHFAVALKYESAKEVAPKVLAKGVDSLAQKIKQIAAENNIPLYEDRELARALYKVCEIGQFIPESLFKAVARILAYIYNLKNYKKRKSIV